MAGFASFLFGGGQTSRSLKLVVIYLALLPLCALAFVHWRHAKPIAGDGGASRPVGTLSEAVENGSPGRAGVRRRLVLMTGDGPWPGALAGRPYIPFAAIPEELKRALLYQEDRAFYTHAGYSPREMYIALRDWLLYGHRLRGASTLTQQLARTIFLSSRRKLSRKLLEFRLALLLEERLPKDRILELYINQVYWGGESRGAAEAARAFYRSPAANPFKGLGPRDFAFLVALLPNPNVCAPAKRPGIAHCRNRGLQRRMTRIIKHLNARDP